MPAVTVNLNVEVNADGIPRNSFALFSELNDVPFNTSILMNTNSPYSLSINANYYSGLVNGVATYVSVPTNLSGVQFRAVLSNTATWSNSGGFDKPTPLSPIQVVSNVFTVA